MPDLLKGEGPPCVQADGDCDRHKEDHGDGGSGLLESNWMFVPCGGKRAGVDMVTQELVVHRCGMWNHDDWLRHECNCGHRWVE